MRESERFVLHHGETVERETFGITKEKLAESLYVPYESALSHAKERQNPVNPKAAFARDLRIEVMDKLGIQDPQEYSNVRFYTAVGTSFDRYHGVDGFLEIDIGKETKRITLDVATREKDSWKADVLVVLPTDNLDPDIDEREYLAMVDKTAEIVVKKLTSPGMGQGYVHYDELSE